MQLIFLFKGKCQSVLFFFKIQFSFPYVDYACTYKDGGAKHSFHGTGEKLYSQNKKMIGQIARPSIKVLLGFFLLILYF